MNRSVAAARVSEMVTSQLNVSANEIAGRDRLYHDLKISGDDAHDLLEAISQEFGISFDKFWVERRFPTEGEEGSLLFWFKKMLGRGRVYVPITLDDLVEIVAESIEKKVGP